MKLSDKEGLRKVLSNAIPLLCQSGLPKETTFRIDAMIGITIDDHEASTLICFSEQIGPNKQPNIMSLLQNDSQFACNEFGSAEDFNKNDEFNNNNNTEFDNNTNKNFNSNSDFNCVNEDNNSTPIESSIETTNNNNNISNNNNNDENKDTTMNTGRKRKRPRKSKPYSNTQLNSYNIKEEEEDEDFYTVKHENDDAFQDNENVEWNNNNNIFDDNNNNDNISNALEENTFNNNINLSNNNNQIDNNNNNNNTLNNNNINNNFSNIDQPWTNNNTPLAQPPPPTQDRKNTRTRRASRKYADYLSETLPLEASTYLEQHSSILSTSLNNLTTTDLNSKDHDTDYNNLMQGICDFVMSQSQHIDDKNRPRSRTCHICQATLSNPLSLKNHIQGTHLALKLRRCNLCGETFKWTMQLARHKKRVHGSTDVLYNLPNGPVANSISNGTVANGGGGYSVE